MSIFKHKDPIEAEIYECAAHCERAGYDVVELNPSSHKGVLLEAHPKYNKVEHTGKIVIRWTENMVITVLPSKTIKEISTQRACNTLTEYLQSSTNRL